MDAIRRLSDSSIRTDEHPDPNRTSDRNCCTTKTDLVVEGLSRKCVRNSMRRQVALQSSAIEVRDAEGALSGNRKALA
jgi:hypothetical protein